MPYGGRNISHSADYILFLSFEFRAYSLPAVISTMLKNWFRWHFLLMVGIHAINVPLDTANRARVDDKSEDALQGHRKVKGQMSASLGPEKLCRSVNPLMCAIKCNSI